MAKSTCASTRSPTAHYPISRQGPHHTSGPAILLVCMDNSRPPDGLQDNIQHMETFFTGLNLRTNRIHIHTPIALERALSIITNHKAGPANLRILAEDSLCFIGVIAYGNNAYTRLPNGATISDVSIEQFFNEEYCVLLRGKPKLFLFFKYYDDSIGGAATVDLRPATATLHTEGVNWSNVTSSTNMNMLSFYIYEFGIAALQTEYRSSIALYELQHAYHRNATDVCTFFREFFNQMIELQSQLKYKRRLPCVCQLGRYRLRSRLYLLSRQESQEEQDIETDISETLSNYSGLSLTGHTAQQYTLNTQSPASCKPNTQSIRGKGSIPSAPYQKHYVPKRRDSSQRQHYSRKPYSHTSYQHRRYSSNSQKSHEYYSQPKRKGKSWKKIMRVKRKRSQKSRNQYRRYSDVTAHHESTHVNTNTVSL